MRVFHEERKNNLTFCGIPHIWRLINLKFSLQLPFGKKYLNQGENPSKIFGPGATSFLWNSILHGFSLEIYWQTREAVSDIKWWSPPASQASTRPGQYVNKSASQPERELNPPLRKTLKEPVSKKQNIDNAWIQAGREAALGFCQQMALEHADQSVWIGDNLAC